VTLDARPAGRIATPPPSVLFDEDEFPLYVRRQALTRFLVRHELFKMVLPIHGSIIECGVNRGGGLMAWAHFSAIYEPYNHTRKVVGFDTFEGFPSLAPEDGAGHAVGDLAADSYDEILRCATAHDRNRPVGHIAKVELVKGDATTTISEYLKANPHLLVALLYLDFDLYEPTMAALQGFVDRISPGGVIAFDELDLKLWPGETQAYLRGAGKMLGRLQRFPWQSTVSYVVVD